VGEPSCPDWLSHEAKAEWQRIVPQLIEAGVLSEVNRAALTAYCTAWAHLLQAEHHLQKDGAVLVSKEGFSYQNPWLGVANRAQREFVKLLAEFGATPASAGKVTPADMEADPRIEFFGKDKSRFFALADGAG
jgi:P27 family predicted phage terminase small subunit